MINMKLISTTIWEMVSDYWQGRWSVCTFNGSSQSPQNIDLPGWDNKEAAEQQTGWVFIATVNNTKVN